MSRFFSGSLLGSVLLGSSLLVTVGSLSCATLPDSLRIGSRPAWELPPPAPAEGPIVDARSLHRTTLPNGLRILILEDDRLPRVALGIELARGEGSVEPSRAGVAEIATEVMQRGAGERDGLALANIVEEAGASLSISADWDTTGVALAGLSEDQDLFLEILADVTLRPRFDPEEFRKTLDEHQAGLVAAHDDPATLIGWQMLRVLYEGHRYGLPSSGTSESVASLSVEDARRYWVDRFVPRNSIFWAVGDVDAAQLTREIEGLFGGLVDAPIPTNTPRVPAVTPESRRIVVIDKPELGQARIVFAHEGITRTEPKRLQIDLMNDALGGSGFSSRLMKSIRSEAGLTYGVGSGYSLRSVAGPFQVSTFTRVPKVREVVDLIVKEVEGMRGEGAMTEIELAKFISYNVGRFGLSLETSQSVLSSLVDLEVHGLPMDSLDTYRSRIRAITLADVHAAARDHLHPDRAAIIVLGPAKDIVPQLEDLGPVEVWQP